MKLQKLVYTARGQHLGFTDDKPPTDEVIQAWRFGPSVRGTLSGSQNVKREEDH